MDLIYRQATLDDLDFLTETRITVLRAANLLSDSEDMDDIRKRSYAYYQKALTEGSHIAYLVFDGDRFVGAGGISFYTVMPTFHNPTGQNGYIMNMYTAPSYRRLGIASHTLQLLISAAHQRGVTRISLDATKMGRPLYQKHGFVPMPDEMELPYSES